MYAQYQRYQNQSKQYQQEQQQPAQIVPPNPVTTFTQYYHGWTKRVEEISKYLKTCSDITERQNAESNCQWAKYYAEESSRAAHHFHQNPYATTAPFALPPVPPTLQSSPNSNPASTTNKNATKSYASVARTSGVTQNRREATTSSSSNNDTTAGSMTRYVKRNIERPKVKNDPKLRKHVQSEIEKVIASAIQKHELQSKNWDLEPLIALPGEQTEKATHQPYRQEQHQSYSGHHYYEHSSSAAPIHNNNYDGNNSSHQGNNYYGSASTGAMQLSSSGSYYGPASSYENTKPTHNFQQFGNNHNTNSLSSSPSDIGKKNKNIKGKRHLEEDFIGVGHYGPSSPKNKKNKKKSQQQEKNFYGAAYMPAIGSMDNGLDQSEQAMAKRASRFSGRGGLNETNSANLRISHGLYSNNDSNYKYMGKGTIGGSDVTLDETDFEQMTVKGTATKLEKEYLRLTAPPRAELVRPLEILQQHLKNLQVEYFGCKHDAFDGHDSNNSSNMQILQTRMQQPQTKWQESDGIGHRKRHDYLWFCSQLKALRQDCTVQRIQGDLAIDVYETHARIALQEGDLNEYNQCQTQLKELYDTLPSTDSRNKSVLVRNDVGGVDARDDANGSSDQGSSSSIWKHKEEFIAYRLLYYVFLSTNETYSGGSSDMFHIMLSLSPKERDHPAIHHALKVREAVAFSDYFWFFRLHKTSPNLGVFLTELLVPTMRLRGLRRIAKAYRPSVEAHVCLRQLGFCNDEVVSGEDEKDGDGPKSDNGFSGKIDEEGKSWMISCGCVIDGATFVTKDSNIHAPEVKDKKKNSLI